MARKTLSTFFNQETSNHNQSQTYDQSLSNQIVSPLRINPENSPLNSQSPDFGWSFSPPSSLTPSDSSLLYCCISSLRRDGGIHSISVAGNLVLTGSSSRRLHACQSTDCHAKGYIQTNSGEIRTMITHDDILITSHKDLKIRIWKIKNNNSFNQISLPKFLSLSSTLFVVLLILRVPHKIEIILIPTNIKTLFLAWLITKL